MIVENTLFGVVDKVKMSIERLKHFEPEEGYYFANSGGKDSTVVRDLLIKSGVQFDAHYMNTTIDPPELVKFIRENHLETKMHYPPRPYFKEIVRKGFPIRQRRWCCEFLKEWGGNGRLVVTGIRWQESNARLKRRMMEPCNKREKWYLNPIIDWSEIEIWEYIHQNDISYCGLYDIGFKRIGCLACPNAPPKKRFSDMERYPRVRNAYVKAFTALWEKNKHKENYQKWNDGEDMFTWWLSGQGKEEDEMSLFT